MSNNVRKTVISYLHWSGENYGKLSNKQFSTVYMMCDGFGLIDEYLLGQIGYDWSHIRDSSSEAINNVYNYLKSEGVIINGQ